jgi:hypothetical protein
VRIYIVIREDIKYKGKKNTEIFGRGERRGREIEGGEINRSESLHIVFEVNLIK